jgi:hypothetical protein
MQVLLITFLIDRPLHELAHQWQAEASGYCVPYGIELWNLSECNDGVKYQFPLGPAGACAMSICYPSLAPNGTIPDTGIWNEVSVFFLVDLPIIITGTFLTLQAYERLVD